MKKSMGAQTKKLVFLGLAAGAALVLSYVESLLPPLWSAVPGIKMGLPNMVIIFLLYRCGVKEAAAVSLVRLGLSALLFGNLLTLAFSFAGAALSLVLMALMKKTKLFSIVGISVAGGVAHNLGQILIAMLVMETAEIGYYMIFLTISGTVAGAFIGLAGALLIQKTRRLRF